MITNLIIEKKEKSSKKMMKIAEKHCDHRVNRKEWTDSVWKSGKLATDNWIY